MNNLLAVIPASDYGSKTAAEWALLALDGKSYKQLPMSPQSGLDLKRGQIQAEVTVLSKAAPGQAIVCYFGHGLEDCWAVYSDNGGGPPLTFQRRILEKNDAQIFAGVVVTSIACFTGKILGQEIAAKGGVFVGFTSLIAWYPPIEQTGTALRNCFAESWSQSYAWVTPLRVGTLKRYSARILSIGKIRATTGAMGPIMPVWPTAF